MIVRKLRLRRAWSQETLAELSGLSVRTIQRIERGKNPGLESLKALASVLEVDITVLQELQAEPTIPSEPPRPSEPRITFEEEDAIRYVRDLKAFYAHAFWYGMAMLLLLLCSMLGFLQYATTGWSALGWGVGVVFHGLVVFQKIDLFGAGWQRRQIEKRLGRKL